MFKGLASIGSLMKQAQEMGGKMKELQEELKSHRATGSAGGGMVDIEINGANEILSCKIEESLLASGDRELLEDMIVTATNQALAKAKEMHAEAMKSLTGGLNLPGLDEAMAQINGE
jgi:hypothetical protein